LGHKIPSGSKGGKEAKHTFEVTCTNVVHHLAKIENAFEKLAKTEWIVLLKRWHLAADKPLPKRRWPLSAGRILLTGISDLLRSVGLRK
jgi:hypothetical protein